MQPLKSFKTNKEQELMRLIILKWFCDQNKWASKHMHVLAGLFGKEFTTKDLPFKSSRSYELIKEWELKGLIKVTDYMSKARKYTYITTLFAKTIENQRLSEELKNALLEKLDELIEVK